MMSKAFCKLMRFIPVNRSEPNPVNILSMKYERDYLLNSSWETQIDV